LIIATNTALNKQSPDFALGFLIAEILSCCFKDSRLFTYLYFPKINRRFFFLESFNEIVFRRLSGLSAMIKLNDFISFKVDFGIPIDKNYICKTAYTLKIRVLAIFSIPGRPVEFAVCTDNVDLIASSMMDKQFIDGIKDDPGFEIHPDIYKFLSKGIRWISLNHVIESTTDAIVAVKTNFTQCHKCSDWVYMAGPNQKDGTFVCRPCREDPYRFSV